MDIRPSEPSHLSLRASDGVELSLTRVGAGRPILFLHGTSADSTRWAPTMARLGDRFAVHALDRRGRGRSGDGTGEYRIEQEFDDVVAAVHAVGDRVDVVAHSFGAICALEAAMRTDRIRALVAYEPPLSPTPQPPPPVVPEMEALLARGDLNGVLEAFLRGYVGIPAPALAQLKSQPSWQARLSCAHTIPREIRAAYAYPVDRARLARLACPVTLLQGSESHVLLKEATALLQDVIPGARLTVLAGQHHVAMDSAPELFIDAVLSGLA